MTKSKSLLLVLLIHSFFLFQAIKREPLITPKVAHKIKVQTIIQTPVVQTVAPAPKAPPPKPKPAPKVIHKAAPKPTPAPPIQKKVAAKKVEPPKPLPDLIPPAPIQKLNIESEPDPTILANLIAIMQETLSLPEVGEVKIELTITAEGKVKELKVLSSHSDLNRQYLETHLPELIFPVREKGLFKQGNETFVFAFHSL
jgi:hypothetical protein